MRVAAAVPYAVVLVAAVRRGWHRRLVPAEPPVEGRRWALGVWALLIAATVAFQLGMYVSHPRELYPTFSSMAGTAFGWQPVRAVAFAAWLGLGWYVVER